MIKVNAYIVISFFGFMLLCFNICQAEMRVTESLSYLSESQVVTGSETKERVPTLSITTNITVTASIMASPLPSQNVSATFDFNLPKPAVPKNIETSVKEAVQEELYWDNDKFGPQKGVASLYGGLFHRKKTTSGERHDIYSATAAHKKLPFGTEVKVTNMESGSDYGKSVVVRINDRGPFVHGRVIDLSIAAAKKIGLTIGKGISKVKLEIFKPKKAVSASINVPTQNMNTTSNAAQTATQNIK